METNRPDCFRCRHLRITWESGRGYACRAMNFKSSQIPWRVVLANSGKPCMCFEPKPPTAPNDPRRV